MGGPTPPRRGLSCFGANPGGVTNQLTHLVDSNISGYGKSPFAGMIIFEQIDHQAKSNPMKFMNIQGPEQNNSPYSSQCRWGEGAGEGRGAGGGGVQTGGTLPGPGTGL